MEKFWKTGILNSRSNVQFGEGGAGTFSDGKLNTLVKDPSGRIRAVLQMFVEAGAPSEILYQQKPHLGTDVLMGIVESIRRQIEASGGRFLFHTQVIDFLCEDNRISGLLLENGESLPRQWYVPSATVPETRLRHCTGGDFPWRLRLSPWECASSIPRK